MYARTRVQHGEKPDEFCRMKGHVQSVCQHRDKENTSSTSHDKALVGSLLDADGPMFCTMTGIRMIKLTSSEVDVSLTMWSGEMSVDGT